MPKKRILPWRLSSCSADTTSPRRSSTASRRAPRSASIWLWHCSKSTESRPSRCKLASRAADGSADIAEILRQNAELGAHVGRDAERLQRLPQIDLGLAVAV